MKSPLGKISGMLANFHQQWLDDNKIVVMHHCREYSWLHKISQSEI